MSMVFEILAMGLLITIAASLGIVIGGLTILSIIGFLQI